MSEHKLSRGHSRTTAEPKDYNTREVQLLHRARLLDAYQAYCARVPQGFNPVAFSTWAVVTGVWGTLWADKMWQAPKNRRIEESNG